MPLHEFQSTCGHSDEVYVPITESPTPFPCPCCPGLMRRRFHAPAMTAAWVGHFNHSVGQWVGSHREFRAALARGAEEASISQNRDVTYTEVHPADRPPPSEEGLDEQRKARRENSREA